MKRSAISVASVADLFVGMAITSPIVGQSKRHAHKAAAT